jgi:hypothetical protein
LHPRRGHGRRHQLLVPGNRGGRPLVLRVVLRDLEPLDGAALEAQVEDSLGASVFVGAGARDLELTVEPAQRQRPGNDARDEREHQAAPALHARVDLRLRCLALAAHAAEEVDLPP